MMGVQLYAHYITANWSTIVTILYTRVHNIAEIYCRELYIVCRRRV